jgi:hypothetical protein
MTPRLKNLILACLCFAAGALAVATFSNLHAQPGDGPKGPKWSHGMSLKVRKATEPDFNDKTGRYGIEVFRDENNGNLIYVSETGAIAVVPGK